MRAETLQIRRYNRLATIILSRSVNYDLIVFYIIFYTYNKNNLKIFTIFLYILLRKTYLNIYFEEIKWVSCIYLKLKIYILD
jgi:hypothetical protein